MSGPEVAAIAVCALPLCAAVANGLNALTGERLYGQVAVARVAVVAVVASFAASLYVAASMMVQPGPREVSVYRFIGSGDLSVDFGFLLDPLSVVMMLVVTGISALVTHFSVNYMHNEDGFTRYFTVVPLFVFAMLVLVMADNYLVMFLGWEGVGVCSYLLIGFYRERPASAQAATKAFVMNRVGDAGLLLAMFMLMVHTGTLQYGEVFAQAPSMPRGAAETVGLLLLLGATGKSAQLPLGTWLGRAMEGPTPSSALMHAATMVTAGVYLVVRSSPIYDHAPTALVVVGIVGLMTALYGQLVGYTQTDIKGMLASSTTAQLGLMFLFCGLGLYAVAIFHLVAHAFYKTYLFLTAPSILHHLHGGADPTAVSRPADTARVFAVSALAVAAGLLAAPLVGRVLEPTESGILTANVWVLLALGVIAAFAVVIAVRRMTAVAFAGPTDHSTSNGAADGSAHAVSRRRGPLTRLVVPLIALAGLVALGRATEVLPGGLPGSWFQGLLGGAAPAASELPAANPVVVALFMVTIALLLLSGWFAPRYLDRFRAELPAGTRPPVERRLYWAALNGGYLDDLYGRAVIAPTVALGRALERLDNAVFDRPIAPPPVPQVVTWEDRFRALSSTPRTDAVPPAEAPERLDWLPGGPAAAVPGAREHTYGAAPRTTDSSRLARGIDKVFHERSDDQGLVGAAANGFARLVAGIERVVFQRAAGHGVIGAFANAFARLAENIERVFFQSLDATAGKLTGAIAGITDAVESAVFQRGVERGVANAAAGAQQALLAVERRLGQPLVVGSILALALVILIIGTG